MRIWLNTELVEKCKEELVKNAKEELGESEEGEDGLFDDNKLSASVEDLYFEDGCIKYCYSIKYNGVYLMNYTDDIEIGIDLGAEIISHFMKKLGKLKTVLEATK